MPSLFFYASCKIKKASHMLACLIYMLKMQRGLSASSASAAAFRFGAAFKSR